MNQQPDKFFRDKLQGYQQTAPPTAWNKVSQNVRNKRRSVWLRYAAALLIATASGVAIYPLLTERSSEPMAVSDQAPETNQRIDQENAKDQESSKDQETPSEQRQPLENESPVKNPLSPDIAENKQSSKPFRVGKNRKAASEAIKTERKVDGATEATDRVSKKVIPEDKPALLAADTQIQTVVEPEVAAESKPKRVTIVFTAEEVNRRYLQKKMEAEATPEAKGSSGLKKLLDKANDLTTNQDLLGDLRQKKNEILAMNFKSEKPHSETD